MLFRIHVLLSAVLFTATAAHAAPFELDRLPDEPCALDEYNSCIASEATEGKWVLRFEAAENEQYETRAVISIDGKLVRLNRTHRSSSPGTLSKRKPSLGQRESYTFVSDDKLVRATLNTSVISTSCEVDTDSCCGDNYKGMLVVTRGKQRLALPVAYYRGG